VGADGTTLEAENGEVVSDIDVILFASGFDISAPFMAARFDIRARGATLGATLKAKPEAYYGMAVAGYPNMFTLLGPNTGWSPQAVNHRDCDRLCVMLYDPDYRFWIDIWRVTLVSIWYHGQYWPGASKAAADSLCIP
jgi:hypothetical protein